MMNQVFDTPAALYRLLPSVDSLLAADASQVLINQFGKSELKRAINEALVAARASITAEQRLPQWLLTSSGTFEYLAQHLQQQHQLSLRPVHNLTGTILHTNLGRSQQSEAAIAAVTQVMRHATPLEFELEAGKRGHRDNAVSKLINRLTGAEACCVVNNNAAAVILMLSSVCAGKEVIVSRGELVEIGGAFRIPDIMRQAGCTLVEVGSTNRTHLRDYEEAITENTGAIMKVHTSNYHIQGFTSSVDELTLGRLCRGHNIPLISDLGSGALTDLRRFGLKQEPMPQQMLSDGVDLVSFSGDKLLGGPQSGLIVGKQALIDKLQKHPLKRALRCDKLILAALEATLLHYLNPQTLDSQLPIMAKFARTEADIRAQAERFVAKLAPLFAPHYHLEAVACQTQVGSGSQPDTHQPSTALAFTAQSGISLTRLERHLKSGPQPIIGRMANEQLLLDLRGADNYEQLLTALVNLGAPT